MVPSGPPTPGGGALSVPQSLLRSNSGVLAGQGGPSQSSQPTFGSLSSPHMQIGNGMNMPGNASIMSSLLNQPFGNSGAGSLISGHRGGLETGGAESDPLSNVGNGIGFNAQSSFVPSTMINSSSSGQVRGQQFGSSSSSQLLSEQQQAQQLEIRNFQQAQHNQLMQQQQFQAARGGLAGVGPVKVEPQAVSDQYRQLHQPQQQLQAPRNVGSVKLEPQQFPTMRSMGQVKMEPQISDPSLFLQQQQQFLHMPAGQSSQAQLNLLQQQRLLQQHQQHQLLKAMPQQRRQFPQQVQQQSLPSRPPTKPVYEPGMCAQRLTQYMYQQQLRPEDNNIEFWRKFVAEYFAPNARKRWCVSMYGSGRQTTGVFPQDAWHCEICNRKPGRGFEATVEVLPRLFKIKYESGTLEELLYVDMPRESQNAFGQIVLEYAKAIQESVFEQLRVVRDGQLRIVFSPDLKICSWEFCARRHEELIPRRLLIPQVSQLGSAAQKYQQAAQNALSDSPASDLQNNCNMFVASARQLAKALEVPLVNDLGYTKRYVRCLQISEVVNSMKDLIDYSRETRNGPIESLNKYPRRTGSSSTAVPGQAQGSDEQLRQQQPQNRTNCQNTNGNQSSIQGCEMQANPSNSTTTVNKSSASTIAGLLHQNSMNSRQQNSANNPLSPYGGNSVQMSSPSSSTIPVAQQHNMSSFQSPTSSSNNNLPQQSQNGLPSTTRHMSAASSPAIQQPVPSGEPDPIESQSSVQKILHEIMANNQLNSTGGGMVGTTSSFGNDVKNVNGTSPANNASVINGRGNGIVIGGSGFGMMGGGGGGGGGFGQSAAANGIRAVMGNNNNSVMNGRVGMMAQESSMNHQQQDLRNQLLGGLGAVNGFNNLQFDWSGC